MQYSYAAIAAAAFAGVVHAQSQCLTYANSIPPCALGYIVSEANSIGDCDIVDFQCQCSILVSIENAFVTDAPAACLSSVGSILNAGNALCDCASSYPGQTISLDPADDICQFQALDIPPCGLGYIASAGLQLGCALDDFECQCSSTAGILSLANSDLSAACGTQYGSVLASAEALCSCISSVDAPSTTAVSPSTTSTPVSATSSAASPGSATTTPIVSPTVSVPGGAPTPTVGTSVSLPVGGSSMSMGSSAGSMSMGSSAGSMSMGSSSGSGSGSSPGSPVSITQQSATGTSSLPMFTNAAATVGPIGGVMGAVAAIIAFL